MQRLILGDPQAHRRREFVNLPPLAQHDIGVSERGLAVHADGRTLLHERLGRRHQMQRLPAMAQLPAGLLATLLAQTLRPAGPARQSVAGGRLRTGAAVSLGVRYLRFQLGVARQQLLDLLALLVHQRFQFGDALFSAHAPMLHCRASLPDLLRPAQCDC